jgi:sec-independent protein translocase protein TatC
MTLGEHIAELRNRVLVALAFFIVAAFVSWFLYPSIVHALQHPYCQIVPKGSSCKFFITGPLDGLALHIKISAYGGLFLSSPVILWEIWRFITPGLRRNEKRYAIPFILASITLFSIGAGLAFFTFPHALGFLIRIGGPSLQQIFDPVKYLSLIVAMMTIFGLTFLFPVVLVALELAGVLKPASLASWRRWAFVLILLGAAVITPSGDPVSMLVLAVPLYAFYEISIVIGRLVRRSR